MYRNASSAEKGARMKVLLKLKQQEDIIEKGFASAIANMKVEPDILKDLLNDYSETTILRKNFVDSMRKDLDDIITGLESVKLVMKDPEKMQKLDVGMFKQKLIKLSQSIHEFKQSYSVQSLRDEQISLEHELKELQSNPQKSESMQNLGSLVANQGKGLKRIDADYKEVEDFHGLVAKTGHTENWSEDDHLLFLRIRKKCNSIPALVTAIQTRCPDLSAETIVNHETWYRLYLELREKQKSSVKEWRRRKELERERKIEDGRNNVEELPRETVPRREPLVMEKPVVRRAPKISREVSKDSNEEAGSKDETKELIRKWRTEKERKRIMDMEQIKTQTRLKRERQEAQKERRFKKIQEALTEYRNRKSAEAVSKKADEAGGKRKCDMTLIMAFRKEDQEYVNRRRKMISQLKPPRGHCETRKRGSFQRIQNRSTLFEPTKVWAEKCRFPIRKEERSIDRPYIKDIPKLCIRWRNEVSVDLPG